MEPGNACRPTLKVTIKAFLEDSSAFSGSNCPITVSGKISPQPAKARSSAEWSPASFNFNDQPKIQVLKLRRRGQGHGKGIQATVLVPITSLRNSEHQTSHEGRRNQRLTHANIANRSHFGSRLMLVHKQETTHNPNVFETQGWRLMLVHRQGTTIQTCLNKGLQSNVFETEG